MKRSIHTFSRICKKIYICDTHYISLASFKKYHSLSRSFSNSSHFQLLLKENAFYKIIIKIFFSECQTISSTFQRYEINGFFVTNADMHLSLSGNSNCDQYVCWLITHITEECDVLKVQGKALYTATDQLCRGLKVRHLFECISLAFFFHSSHNYFYLERYQWRSVIY